MPGKMLVAIADANGTIRLVNRHCEEAVDCSLAELRGLPLWEGLPATPYIDRMHQSCLRLAAGGHVDDDVGLWRTRLGRPFAVHWSYSAWHDEAGAAHGIVIAGRRVEAAPARQHTPRLATLLGRMPLIGTAHKADTANRLIERILGSNLLARPDGAAAADLRRGDPAAIGGARHPPRAGPLAGLRRRQDLALRTQAELGHFYRAIIDAAAEAIVVLSPDGTVQLWSRGAERLLGYSEDQVKHRTISFLATPEQLTRGLSPEDAAWPTDRHRAWQTVKQRQDGSIISVTIEASPIRDSGGQHSGAVWILRALHPPRGDSHEPA